MRDFSSRAHTLQIACLDVNGDGVVNAADATPGAIPDLTGDGVVDERDASLVEGVEFTLPEGRPDGCDGQLPEPDWQVTEPAEVECVGDEIGVIVVAVGGGAVDLSRAQDAAGARWMMTRVGEELDDGGVPHQLVSVAPGMNGTSAPQPNTEIWLTGYLQQQLEAKPCLRAVLLGHSHGGTTVTAVASRLEEMGVGGQIVMNALVDRVTGLYGGDRQSIPQTAPVFNVYLSSEEGPRGQAIDQPNVENWDASAVPAPVDGEEGGELAPATHTTIDNSPAVLDEVLQRVMAAVDSAAVAATGT